MIAVLGAGAVGAYVGGRLAASGAEVAFIGRSGPPEALARGLHLRDRRGQDVHLPAESYACADAATGLAGADWVLVCVKSRDTGQAAKLIARHAPPEAQVVSLQNGLENVETLAHALGEDRVIAGMIGFNVIRPEPALFQQATEGELIVGPRAAALAEMLSQAGLPAQTNINMRGVQWSKLVLNLNNPLNALSGQPLRDQLLDRDWRRILAACAAEALAVGRARGVRFERLGRVHPAMLPRVLPLPTWIFRRLASGMMRIGPEARSSMADDLAAGLPSELPWLNGRVVTLGTAAGVPTPVNAAVVSLTAAAFAVGRSPGLSGAEARARLGLS